MAAMMAASTSLKAQEVTIVLMPGYTWICNPGVDTLDFATALGSFTPMAGDVIKSQFGNAFYRNGQWYGNISQFYPGHGYHYYSKRTEPVTLTLSVQSPLQVVVTTSEPTDITTESAVVGGAVTIGEGNYVFSRGICWGAEPNPTFNDSLIEAGNGSGSFTVTMNGLTPGTTYYVRAFAVTPNGIFYGEELNFITLGGGDSGNHAYVDLGLPSGTLWATCNVGADTPDAYGDYFAWGETQPKSIYNWSTYQYSNGGTSWQNPNLTKYCSNSSYGYNGFTDNLTTLLPDDDAATVNWGSYWRMPTKEEWQELYQNTTHSWTMQNGVNGRLFTASNGNSLFLPAAGYRDEGSLYNAGSGGDYWSSSLYTGDPIEAWYFYLYSGDNYMHYSGRNYGLSIRAVRSVEPTLSFMIDAISNPAEGGTVTGSGTYEQGQSCTLTATPNVGYTFTNWTEDGEVVSTDAIYTFTVNADRNLVANFTAPSVGGHAYVDLGLPSGLLWATCNVGADTPDAYGDYFAWGENSPKSEYNWSTYQYFIGRTLTKYTGSDGLTTLLPEDDAATANWGADWRMPTKEEWQELLSNTNCIWTTQNGVNGRLFTASNGNSLFLPAAGSRSNSSLSDAGSYGDYWSSSLHTGNPNHAWECYFGSGNIGSYTRYRYYGHSVRAVRSSAQN